MGIAALAVVPSCGGTAAGSCGSAPPVDSSTPITELTSAQAAELCDWGACTLGGYGAQHACEGGTVSAEPNQADCVQSIERATCSATVGDFTGCFDAVNGDPCALLSASACSAFFECATPM